MKNKVLKEMYDCFYVPLELPAQKKKIIVTATITSCIALCAAVWPQAETVEETPLSSELPAVTAPRPTLPEPEPEVSESSSEDMVYVEGFGWIESQGPNQAEYAEDMYENGNKIGSMG